MSGLHKAGAFQYCATASAPSHEPSDCFGLVQSLQNMPEMQLLPMQKTFQRRDTTSSRSSSMELLEEIPLRPPPRHSIDVRHAATSRHSIDLSRAHSVRPSAAAAAQASTLSRGSTSQSDNSSWESVSSENKGIIRQVKQQTPCMCQSRGRSKAVWMAVQVALKCADIGHLAASPDVHNRWALLLEEEFFLQVSSSLRNKTPSHLHAGTTWNFSQVVTAA